MTGVRRKKVEPLSRIKTPKGKGGGATVINLAAGEKKKVNERPVQGGIPGGRCLEKENRGLDRGVSVLLRESINFKKESPE